MFVSKILRVITQRNSQPVTTSSRKIYSLSSPVGKGLLGLAVFMAIAYPQYVKHENKKIHEMYDEYGGKGKHNYYVEGENP